MTFLLLIPTLILAAHGNDLKLNGNFVTTADDTMMALPLTPSPILGEC